MHSITALRHLIDEMLASSKRVLEYSRNPSAIGLHRERLVESYIKRIAPKAFGIGSGFIYGKEKSSNQIDILVYDRVNFSPLFDEGSYIVTLPSSVVHVIEVKSKLDKQALFSATHNIISATSINEKIHGIVFAFDGISWSRALNHIDSYVHKYRNRNILNRLPRMFVNLGKWVIFSIQERNEITYWCPKNLSFEEQFVYFFSELYYSMYGYQRKLCRSGALPTLEEQGFRIQFDPGECKGLYLQIRPKKP